MNPKVDLNVSSTTVEKIYDDLLSESNKTTSTILGLIPRTIKSSLNWLEIWNLNSEYKIKETKILLEKKLKDIAEDKIVPPDPHTVIPAIQALSYSMNSDELRNLYVNLLSKAVNIDTKDKIHPAFVEIIKQLSPIDAVIFQKFVTVGQHNPVIDVIERNIEVPASYKVILHNLTNILDYEHLIISSSIYNLNRLGLVTIQDKTITDDSAYDTITSTKEFYNFKNSYNLDKGYKLDIVKKIITINDFGYSFANICLK